MKVWKLTNAVIGLLQRCMEDRQYPIRNYPRFLFKENGFEVYQEAKFDFGLLLFDLREKILQLAELAECAKYMTENPVIRKTFKVFDKDGRPIDEVPLDIVLMGGLRPFLVAYLNRVGSLTFDEGVFENIYSDFESNIYRHEDKYSITSPLENFSCDSNIDLGEGLRIRRITDEERAEYLSQGESFAGFPTSFGASDILTVKQVLETTYLHRRGTPMDTSRCRESFEDIVTALRLFKPGAVDFNVLCQASASWQPHLGHRYSSQLHYISPIGPKYSLLDSEVRSFRRVWKTYIRFKKKSAKSDSTRYLDIALRRFNLGVEESDSEDKMIDYMISFEALCLPEASELKYKLSNRVATLLAEETKQAMEIRKTLANAYDLRSDIVHGRKFQPIKIEGKTIEPRDFCSRIENYLRMCIRLFIALNETYKRQKAIINLIDEALFNIELKRELARTRKREMVFERPRNKTSFNDAPTGKIRSG